MNTNAEVKLYKSEIQIQAECFQFLWNNYPLTRRCFFHVPNGGSRNKIEGMQLKASGVVPGVCDMILLWRGRAYGFEVKTSIGIISPDQEKVHAAWRGQDVRVEVVRDIDEFRNLIIEIIG